MFVLYRVTDGVHVEPHLFQFPLLDIAKQEIGRRYPGRVLHSCGFVVTIFDFEEIGDPIVHPSSRGCHSSVVFRALVFRPFIGEIIIGTISSSDKDGVYISLGFFRDIFIPHDSLQHPSDFVAAEKKWFWRYGIHSLPMNRGNRIRFRVTSVEFGNDNDDTHPGMRVVGTVREDGLGLCSWWS